MQDKKTLWELIKNLGFVVGLGIIVFAGVFWSKQRKYHTPSIVIEGQQGNLFVTEGEILETMQGDGRSALGSVLGDIDLRAMELQIKSNKFVKGVNSFQNVAGGVNVQVLQRRPLARVSLGSKESYYLGTEGEVLPLSVSYVARVVVVTGAGVRGLKERGGLKSVEGGQELLELLSFLDQDEFLRALISGVEVTNRQEVVLYPQVGGFVINLGKPKNIRDKFDRLRVFYQKVLPVKGESAFKSISLKYAGQVVCR